MKRLLAYLFLVLGLVLLNYNGYLTAGIRIIDVQSSLPECKGNDKNISKYSKRYFKKTRKWTNCHGTFIGNKDGVKYVGEWKDGVQHGQGTITWASGKFAGVKYVGGWKDGEEHGQGTWTHPSGEKYVGEWKDGTSHGQGTTTLADGDKYVGEHKDGKRHGLGTATATDGRVKKGIWENGVLVEPN
jgi:hypothetical protein